MSKLTILEYLTKNNKLTSADVIRLIAGRQLETVTSKISNSGHNYPKKFKCVADLTGRISGLSSGNIVITTTSLANIEANPKSGDPTGRSGIYLHELLMPVSSKTQLIEELTIETEKFKKFESELSEKIKILEELGLEEYDDKIIKIVSVMGAVNPDMKSEEKLKFADALVGALQ